MHLFTSASERSAKGGSIQLDHFCLQHQLLSGHVDESEHMSLLCPVCELGLSGEVYYCIHCILVLKFCIEELLNEIVHYLHPEHHLILLSKPLDGRGSFQCRCCQNHYSGMVVHCVSCEFDLDPECALQTFSALRGGAASKIKHFGHDHLLTLCYFKERETCDFCKACCKLAADLAYSCDSCVYFLHKSCAELPLQLEHPLHPPHPLVLFPGTLFFFFWISIIH